MPRRAPRVLLLPAALLLAAMPWAAPARATTIPADAVDQTSASSATINFPTSQPQGSGYTPKLLAVGRTGTAAATITWAGSFTFHPLRFDNLAIPGISNGTSGAKEFRSGRYAFYCGIHGGSGGVGMSGVVYIAGPRAELQAKPENVAPGGQTTLDASETDLVSYGGATATYEFDPEGDGTYLPPTASPTMQATYATPGDYVAKVRVTDNAGRADEASNWVYVAPPLPPPPPVDPPPPSGNPSSPPAKPGSPIAKPKPAFTALAALPSRKRCVSRKRGLRVVVQDSGSADVRFARVKVNGRPAKRLAVGKRREIIVRGLRGRPDVSVTLWLADGTLLNRTYKYRACGA
jgi:hypothetical protein